MLQIYIMLSTQWLYTDTGSTSPVLALNSERPLYPLSYRGNSRPYTYANDRVCIVYFLDRTGCEINFFNFPRNIKSNFFVSLVHNCVMKNDLPSCSGLYSSSKPILVGSVTFQPWMTYPSFLSSHLFSTTPPSTDQTSTSLSLSLYLNFFLHS